MKIILPLLILISSGQVKAQQFQELIHPGAKQAAKHMAHAVGGGYLLASDFTDSAGEKSILITRLDNLFQVVWHKTIDEPGTVERVNSFAQDPSGNIFIAGYTEDSFATAFYKSVVMKTDSSGNLIWEKILNYSDFNNLAYYILPTSSESIYVVGEAEDDIDNQVAYRQYLMKLNSLGGIQFARDYPESWHSTHSSQILKAPDNQLMVSGWSTTINGNQTGLTKFDTAGNKLWDHRWFAGYASFSTTYEMTYNNTGGYMICGVKSIDSGFYNARNFFAECDSSGNMITVMLYGFSINWGPKLLYHIKSIETSDGGYAAAGIVLMGIQDAALVLFKLDSDLIPQWAMVYDTGFVNPDYDISLLQADDGGYLLATSYDQSILLVKTDANGLSLCNEQPIPIFYYNEPALLTGSLTDYQNTSFDALLYQPVVNTIANSIDADTLCYFFTSFQENTEALSFKLFPNPANEFINLSIEGKIANSFSLTLVSTDGLVWSLGKMPSNHFSINISSLPHGMYAMKINDGKGTIVKKFLKQ